MKSTVVDESLSSFKPMYCSREYQASTRLSQQYEKSTLNAYNNLEENRKVDACINFPCKNENKVLIQMRSQAKTSSTKLPEVHGVRKELNPNLRPEKQHAMPKRGMTEKPHIGQ